ncbi:HAMP domain-containing histidine kinase [Nocardia sp. NBC_01499]|uniref:sensor histidine kinase n=1 Tax=Nocardia sp. NBC_01499 TaxID=2903597 RepID=UPI00386622C8
MSSSPRTEPRRRWSPRRWSLRARLLVGQSLLLATVVIGIGAATVLALQQFLVHQLDTELVIAQNHSVGGAGGGPSLGIAPGVRPPPPPDTPVGPGPDFLDRRGIQPDAIGAAVDHGTVTAAGKIGADGSESALSDAARGQLAEVAVDGKPITLNIDGQGRYRVIADPTWRGTTVVTGLPLASVDATLAWVVGILVAAIAAALLIAITVGLWLIRRALMPLDRVAATAAEVADLQLDRGEVTLPVRVSIDAESRTEVGQLCAAVNRMLEHIAEALSARHDSETRVRQFLADASHELRTPLAAIRGYTELAQRNRAEAPGEMVDAMDRVDAAARRMTTLVEDMFLLARLDSGRPLEHEPVDLSRLTIDAVSDAHIAGPDHRWALDLPGEPVLITGDAVRLHQVLGNLLANARTHTGPGTKVTVSLECDSSGGARWLVRDNGPGIPADLQPAIFQRFSRGDSSRSRRGGSTGLGLAIADAVTKAHGGVLGVTSVPGDTVFTVWLPGESPYAKRT